MPTHEFSLEDVAHQQLVELFDALALMRAASSTVAGPDAEADRNALLGVAIGKVSGTIDALTPYV